MKRFFAGLLLVAASTFPALADVAIKDVVLRQSNEDVNVRVVVTNPEGAQTQEGPITVTLFVRPDSSSDWKIAKTWNDINTIDPGRDLARDAFSGSSPELKSLAGRSSWEARVVVEGPRDLRVEKMAQYTDAANR